MTQEVVFNGNITERVPQHLCPACSPERKLPFPTQRYGRSYTKGLLHKSPSQYTAKDFWAYPGRETGLGIPQGMSFVSKDGVIEANFFYEPHDAQVRAMIFDTKTGDIKYSFRLGFPWANVSDPPTKEAARGALKAIVESLRQKDYLEHKL